MEPSPAWAALDVECSILTFAGHLDSWIAHIQVPAFQYLPKQ